MPNVSLLILWLLPLLPTEGPGRSLDPVAAPHPGGHGAPAAVRRTTDLPSPDDPGRPGLVASLDDEEDSSEDGSLDAPLPPCFGSVLFGREVRPPVAPSDHARPRSSCRAIPLRC